jgi:hypothetical protein
MKIDPDKLYDAGDIISAAGGKYAGTDRHGTKYFSLGLSDAEHQQHVDNINAQNAANPPMPQAEHLPDWNEIAGDD